jgi:ankyrin repeat protein
LQKVLTIAACNDHAGAVKTLLDYASQPAGSGELPPTAKVLLDYEGPFFEVGGIPPLHWAAIMGSEHAARVLVECGADVNLARLDFATPVYLAAGRGQVPVLRVLLAAKAHADTSFYGHEAAASAAYAGECDALRLLLCAKAGGTAEDRARLACVAVCTAAAPADRKHAESPGRRV